jgi:hypothetical protein
MKFICRWTLALPTCLKKTRPVGQTRYINNIEDAEQTFTGEDTVLVTVDAISPPIPNSEFRIKMEVAFVGGKLKSARFDDVEPRDGTGLQSPGTLALRSAPPFPSREIIARNTGMIGVSSKS